MINQYLRKHEILSIFVSIFMICIAILLIKNPVASLRTIVIVFGIGLAVLGLVEIISYVFLPKEERVFSNDVLEGIFAILLGVLMIAWKERVISIFPILIGLWIFIKSILKIQFSFLLKNVGEKGWLIILITGIVSILFGLVIFLNPAATALTVTVIAGVMLLCTEILRLVESIYWLYQLRKI